MYPLTFHEISQKTVWGGVRWQLAYCGAIASVVKNGRYGGLPIDEVLKKEGKPLEKVDFPILIKTLSAKSKLSLQVHPGGAGGSDSKNEILYVLEADAEAEIVAGLRSGVSEGAFYRALGGGEPDGLLKRFKLCKGDLLEIPAGLVHSIRGNAEVLEILENSDTTYRLFDYDNVENGQKRALHLEQAKKHADFSLSLTFGQEKAFGDCVKYNNFKCFHIKIYDIIRHRHIANNIKTFTVVICLKGCPVITNKYGAVQLEQGQVCFLQAFSGGFTVDGKTTILTTSPKYEGN